MGSHQLLKPTCSSPPSSHFSGKPPTRAHHRATLHGAVKRRATVVRCSLREKGDGPTNGEEPPESLFMKELKRRGMNPTSLLEEAKRSSALGEEEEERGGLSGRISAVSSAELEKSLANQRERSMALNSEGLEVVSGLLGLWLFVENLVVKEWQRDRISYNLNMGLWLNNFITFVLILCLYGSVGLVPRAKLLLTLGGSFFLGFGPLILLTVGLFSALYLYFGPSFVHDGTDRRVSPPPYVDPYALLEDERISQTPPSLR